MKRTGKKALSLILTLCMVVSLFAGLTVPAAATADDSWVGTTTFDYTANKTGDGWNWDATSKTLTLFGVNVTGSGKDAIYINGEAKIVLEGANKATGTSGMAAVHIEDNSELTIEGSGTLEAIDGSVGIQAGTLTINSGYITATGLGTGIKVRAVTVNGGYVLATGGSEGIQAYGTDDAVKYEQTGGYVKAVATASTSYGIFSGTLNNKPVTISGGYLEAEAVTAGIHCGAFNNSGGVVKANTGAAHGIKASPSTFSGGVTIAKGTTAAFSAEPTCSGGEEIKDNGTYNAADTEVIIAKKYYTQKRTDLSTLDGVYIKYSGTDPAITANAALTVTGGSYIEATYNYALDASNYYATINGTLVCLNTATNKSAISVGHNKTITIAEQGTLYCNGSGSMGLSNPGIINNSGQLITEGSKAGVAATTINCNDGYIFGLGASELYGGVTASTKLNVVNGYITGIGGIGVSSNGTTVFTAENTETKAMTAICASNKSYANTNIASKGVVVTGTAMKYDPLEPATFSSNNETYMVGTSKAMVVCAKVASGPSAAISGSAIAANTGMAFTGDVTVTLTNAKFAAIDKDADVSAWFTFPDGWADKSAKIKTAITGTDTSVATVTIGGKINNAGSVSLTAGSIPTTAFAEAPADAVVPTGSVAVNITDYSGTLYLVGGTLRTGSSTASPVYTGNVGEWTASAGVLNLDNFVYESTDRIALEIHDTAALTINLTGTNRITGADTTSSSATKGIDGTSPASITIAGSGSLTVTAGDCSHADGNYNTGFGVRGLTVKAGATLSCVSGTSNSQSVALMVGYGDLTVEKGATLNCTAGTAGTGDTVNSVGFNTSGKTFINGSFTATGSRIAIEILEDNSSPTVVNPPALGEGVVAKASTSYLDTAPATAYSYTDIANYKTVKAYVPSAKVADVTVTGYTGEAIASTEVEITLEGYEFANTLGATDGWITNLPADLAQAASRTDATHATITVSGTPSAVSSEQMTIVIPNDCIDVDNDVTVTANANAKFNITAAPDSWVGTEGFFYAEDAEGENGNWSWSASKKTLTLSGVDASTTDKHGINIAAPATDTVILVLEGANKVAVSANKHGLLCYGGLTIRGSGTLEASTTGGAFAGIFCDKLLTIESGYIKASGGYGINGLGTKVTGGYVDASGTDNAGICSLNGGVGYEQTGGYVKAVSSGSSALLAWQGKPITISGGYLEAETTDTGNERYAISSTTGSLTNSGGVIKATSASYNAINARTAEFTGGVTIASSTRKAIVGTLSGNEKFWVLTRGVPAATVGTLETYTDATSVVIAKAIAAPAADANGLITLDGVYLYAANASALNTKHDTDKYYDVAVTGGSYLETTGNHTVITTDLFNPTHALTITGTLVCKGASAGMLVTADTVEVAEDATLYVSNAGLALNAKTSIENSGNLIGESADSHGIGMVIQPTPAPAINVTGGYLCGVSAATNLGCIEANSLTATGGYITGVGGYHCIKVTTSASVTGAAVITASTSGNYAYKGAEIMTGTEKATVIGLNERYKPMLAAGYVTDDKVYAANNAMCAVLLIKAGEAPPPPPYVPDVFYVVVDGKNESIGKLEISGGDKLVVVDTDKLAEKVKAAAEASSVIVNVPDATGKASAELVVKDIDDMADKDMELKVKSGGVEYGIPADAVDTAAILKELGATDPALVTFTVSIKELSSTSVKLSSGTLFAFPIEFTVTATFDGKSTEVKVFEKYVTRTIEVSAADAARITTAVVAEVDNAYHAPTNVFQKNGRWYAKISTLTNSVYALVEYDASFADAKGLWYEAVVSEMASRQIIDGRSDDVFDGDSPITRAEFAALVVRALGLPCDGDASNFTDVAESAWYFGAVGKAYEYKLIEGRGDGTFDPTAKITRQEAMQLIFNAAKVAEFTGTTGALDAFTDAASVSDWASAAAQFNVGSGLVQGDGGLLRPTDNINRAESATIILRLLQKAELVDVRAEA